MAKTGKTLVEFDVKNGKYAVADGTPMPLTYLTKVALEANIGETVIYGDGEEVVTIRNDKGYTMTLGMTAHDTDFETANGMVQAIDGGTASVQRLESKPNSIYFETKFMADDGVEKTKKVWLLNVDISKTGETLDQSTDNPNIATVEYPGKVKGTYLKAATGNDDWVDTATGNKKKVFKVSSAPTDTGYAAFGDTVPTPKAKP